jgi:ABC-type transporter Mla subunit MlaD
LQSTKELIGSSRRIALASRLFLAIAVLSLCASIGLLAYHQGAFTRTVEVFFYAGTADGMHKGMAVKLAGFKVGYLDDISIDNDTRIKVQVKIDRKYVPMIDADATIRLEREGVIGSNVLEVRPGNGDKGPIANKMTLRYEREPSLEAALIGLVDQAMPIMSDVRQITNYFTNPDSEFRQAMSSANRTAAAMAETSAELKKLIASTAVRIEQDDVKVRAALEQADVLLREARSSMAVLDGSLKKIDAALPGIASKMDQSLENIRVTSEAMRSLAVGELPGLVSDTRDVVQGARQSWPLRGMVQPRQELMLRLDSGGGLSTVPTEGGR